MSFLLPKSVPCPSFHYAPSTSLGPIFTRTVDAIQFQQLPMQAKFQIFSLRNASRVFTCTYSFPKGQYGGILQLAIDELSSKTARSQLSTGSSLEQINCEKISAYSSEEHQVHDLDVELHEEASSSAKGTADICDREIQRRRKIGLANKGRIPWNKGRKHSEETRERIKKRTIEALSDPKVRKKMSEFPRSHSDQSKASISSALRKIWEERLKLRRLQENCYLMWAGSIAEAAKEGGFDQEELDWDSYEKMKSDIMSQHLQWKEDKARAKEFAKLRAERAAKIRAENAARLAQRRKEKEEKAKAREIKALARKKSEDKKTKMALSKGLKLKARLTKFHHRKKQLGSSVSIQREMAIEPQPLIQDLDIELIKIDKMRKRVSLADQIRAVKNRKKEYATEEVLPHGFSISSKERAADSSVFLHLLHDKKHNMLELD